jgi:hypothetical protein
MRRHISGREATHMAIESDKRGPVQIEPLSAEGTDSAPGPTGSAILAQASTSSVISPGEQAAESDSMKSEPSTHITPSRPSSPAERMRRHRQRRRRGLRSVRIQLHVTQLEALVRKGYLGPTRYDRGDIEFAIDAFLWDALTDEK